MSQMVMQPDQHRVWRTQCVLTPTFAPADPSASALESQGDACRVDATSGTSIVSTYLRTYVTKGSLLVRLSDLVSVVSALLPGGTQAAGALAELSEKSREDSPRRIHRRE